MNSYWQLAAFTGGLAVMGCHASPPDWPLSSPSELCRDPTLAEDDFCLPAARIERWLKSGHFVVTHAAVTKTGSAASYKLRVRLTDPKARDISFSVRFKPAPDDLDNFDNSPRRELAAYQLQKLFLDEDDYVVPPTVLHCIALEDDDMLDNLQPFGDTGCALGVMAYWPDNVIDHVLDEARAVRDQRYREHLGDLDAFSVLVGQQDRLGRANFLLATDRERPRIFSVDNGLSLDARVNQPIRFSSTAWTDRRVEWMAERMAKRLRNVRRHDLEKLSVLAQLELRRDKIVSVVETAPIDRHQGVRKKGRVLQLGLTAKEITVISSHVGALAESIDSGDLRVARQSGGKPKQR